MVQYSARFDIVNDGSADLLIYIEPEGAELKLQPLDSMQIAISGSENPVVFKHWIHPGGSAAISIWPVNGSYDVKIASANESN